MAMDLMAPEEVIEPTDPIHQNLQLQDPYAIDLETFNEEIDPNAFLGVNNLVLKGNLQPSHDFSGLEGVKKLTLKNGWIADISLLRNLPRNLEELHIQNFNFKNKSTEPAFLNFSIFKNLKKLNWHNEQWSGHGICKISKKLLPENLESLRLSGIRLALNPCFELDKLKELALICPSSQMPGKDQRGANREWVVLENSFFAPQILKSLEKLIIKDVDIGALDFTKFKNLKTFSFEISKKHEKFPERIGGLPETLIDLSISRPELGKTSPFSWDFLSQIPNLKKLSVKNFVLGKISGFAQRSLKLKHLEVKPGSKEIPNLSHLKELTTIDLIIPSAIELDKKKLPQSLETLNLTSCYENDADDLYHKFAREWNGIQIKRDHFRGILQFNNSLEGNNPKTLGIYTDPKAFKLWKGSILVPFCNLDNVDLSKAQELNIEILGLEQMNLSKATNLQTISLRLGKNSIEDRFQNIPIDLRFLNSLPNCKVIIEDVDANAPLNFLLLKEQEELISWIQKKYLSSTISYPFSQSKDEELYEKWTVSIDRISQGFPPNDKELLTRLRLPGNSLEAKKLQERLWNFMIKTVLQKIGYPISVDLMAEVPGKMETSCVINWSKFSESLSGKTLKNVLSHNEVTNEEFDQLEEEYKKYAEEYKEFLEKKLNKSRGKLSQDDIKLLEKDIEILSSLFERREAEFGPLLDNARQGIDGPNGGTNYDLRKAFRLYVYQLKNYEGCWEHPVYKFLTQNFVKDCGQAGYKDFEIPFTALLNNTLDDERNNQRFYETIYGENQTGLSKQEIEKGKHSQDSEYARISEILSKEFLREKESWISQFSDSGLERWLSEGQFINTSKALRFFLGLPEQSVAVHGGALMVSSKRVFEKALEKWTIPNLIQWTQDAFNDLKIHSKDPQMPEKYKIMQAALKPIEKIKKDWGITDQAFYTQDVPDPYEEEEGFCTLKISPEAAAYLLEELGYLSFYDWKFIPAIEEPIPEFAGQDSENEGLVPEDQGTNDIFAHMSNFFKEITGDKPAGDPTINAKRKAGEYWANDVDEKYEKKVKLNNNPEGE